MESKKKPLPDKSINKEAGQEPNTVPSTGQHQPDILDERSKTKHGNRPVKEGDGSPREYNDGEPVEEKSPRASNSL